MSSQMRSRISRPCLGVAGGAALFFLMAARCLAGAIPSPSDNLPRPNWPGVDYEVARTGKWDSTLKRLEEAYADPVIPIKWSTAGQLDDRDGRLYQEGYDFSKAFATEVPGDAVEGDTVFVERFVHTKKPGAVFLKAEIVLDAPANLNILFGTEKFAAVYVGGKELYRGFFDKSQNRESVSVPASFAKGTNAICFIIARQPGSCRLSLRIGTINARRKRIGFLMTLRKMYPDDLAHVLAAEKEIASTIDEFLDDPYQAEIEYRRLYLEAQGDGALQAVALERLAAIYGETGRYQWRAEVLRARMRLLAGRKGDKSGGWAGAAIAYANAAAASGDLMEATMTLREAIAAGGPEEMKLALATAYSRFSLFERAQSSFAALDASKLSKPGQENARATLAYIDGVKLNPAYLDANLTAATRLEAAGSLASQGAFDRAASALIDALDAPGRPLVASRGGAVGTPFAVAALVASDGRLAAAYQAAASASPPRSGAELTDILARRPLSDAARKALRALAVDAAAQGKYGLSALAARRLLADFSPTQGSAAASGASAADVAEATRLLSLSPPDAGSASTPSDETAAAPSGTLEVVWSAPVRVTGTSADTGRIVRPYHVVPRAAGAIYGGNLYVFDGAELRAFDMTSGKRVFESAAPLAPGERVLTSQDITMSRGTLTRRLGFAPPATACSGGGRVFYSLGICDETQAGRIRSILTAVDARKGRILWSTRSSVLGDDLTFVSPPAWGHDRVYILARSWREVPSSYLACFDAADGTLVYAQLLDSCIGLFPTGLSWPSAEIDSGVFAPAPGIVGDDVVAAPNSGAIFSIDALTGIVKAAWTYPRACMGAPGDGLAALLAHRSVRAPAAAGEYAAAAPGDSAEVFVAGSAGMAAAEIPGALEVAGVHDGVAVCVGSAAYGVDVKTGKTLWRTAATGDAISGAIVKDGAAYIPTDDALRVFSAADGKPLAAYAWPAGVARGNLLVDGGAIVAFGEDDVAALRVTASAKGSPAAARDDGPKAAPGGGSGGAAAAASYLLAADGAAKTVFADGDRRYAVIAGRSIACWDITGPATLAWSKPSPLAATNATFADGRIIISDAWTIAAVSVADGSTLWRHESRRLGPVELATVSAVSLVIGAPGRLMYWRGAHGTVVDSATGATVSECEIPGQAACTAGGTASDGSGFFAVTSDDAARHATLRIYGAADGRLKEVDAGGEGLESDARAVASAGKVFFSRPGAGVVDCVDAATGKLVWRHEGQTRLDGLIQLEASGGMVAFVGTRRQATQYVVLRADTGEALHSGYCRGTVYLADGAFQVLGNDSRLRRFTLGAQDASAVASLALEPAWKTPLDWRERNGSLYVLLGGIDEAVRGLAIVRLDAGGHRAGQWALPLTSPGGGITAFEPREGDSFALVANEGILSAKWDDASWDRDISILRAGGGDASVVDAWAQKVDAPAMPDVTIDGDLSDWSSADWHEAGGSRAPARLALGACDAGLLVAVRTSAAAGGSAAGVGSWSPLRLAFTWGPAAGNGVVMDIDGPRSAPGAGGSAPASMVVCRRANSTGGFDYEMRVPWGSMRRQGQRARRGGLSIAVSGWAAPDGPWWIWPQSAALSRDFFSQVTVATKGE